METNNFKIKEKNAVNAPVKDIDWDGSDVQTDDVLLANDGTGKKVIVRVFDFDLPPLRPEEIPTTDQLLDVHKNRLIAFLWRDELVSVDKFKCILSKDKKHFRIFATCQAKAGSVILETPELLQQAINGQSTR